MFRFIVRPLVSRSLSLATVLIVSVFGAQVAQAQSSQCAQFYPGQTAPDYINAKLSRSVRELCNEAYGIFHSGVSRTPLWVAERLTRADLTQAKGMKRENNFHADDRLPANERAELSDYARSGYDRGHMAPNADFGTKQAQYESFTLANMIPQAPELNRGEWEGVESSLRNLAKKRGELYVITGPAFIGNRLNKVGRVYIPSHVWKAVYDPSTNSAGAYWFENTNTAKAEYLSIDELASRIGIQPFPALPKSVRQTKMNLPEPKPYKSRNGGGDSNYRSHSGTAEKSVLSSLQRLMR